jgi:hypothetical protein
LNKQPIPFEDNQEKKTIKNEGRGKAFSFWLLFLSQPFGQRKSNWVVKGNALKEIKAREGF